MVTDQTNLPKVVSRTEWLLKRKAFLIKEKEFTHQLDALNADRRSLPMVKVDKDYIFEGPEGRRSLHELFEGRHQLIVYHFMFDPGETPTGKKEEPWKEGCPGCSHIADNIPHLAHLHARDVSLVMISRAHLSQITPFKNRMGWTVPWYSSFGSEFNYDFHVTIDEEIRPVEYNYMDKAAIEKLPHPYHLKGEQPGLSVFLRNKNDIFHTYSTYGRGLDMLLTTHHFLDLTPYGRQEEFEESPAGWPQAKTSSQIKHHDRYELPKKNEDSCCS